MTRSLYTRNSVFMRVVSTVIVLTFTLSLSGFGYAAPATPLAPDEPVASASAPEAAAPGEQASTGEEAPAPEPSVEAQPTTTDPPAEAEAPPAATQEPAPAAGEDSPAPASEQPAEPVALAAAAVPVAPAAVTPIPWATFQQVDWEAYRISPKLEWSKSNLGAYRENDWIPVRVFVINGGSGDIRIPGFGIIFDYLNSGKNAIAVDDAKEFRFVELTGSSVKDLPDASPYPGGTSDVGSYFSFSGSGSQFHVDMDPTGKSDLVVGAGKIGVLYFQVHLGLTPYWQQHGSHEGAMSYPGSSSQGYFESWNGQSVAAKTISVPVGPAVAPKGVIKGYKFNDLNRDGVRQTGEPFLSGWEFTLEFDDEYTFTKTAVTDANGMFTFTVLPEGHYNLTETAQSPWQNSTPLPMQIDLGKDEVRDGVYVGNYLPDVVKTWSLSIDTLPVGITRAWATYDVGVTPNKQSDSIDLDLSGDSPYTATESFPVNTVISNIRWWVHWNGADIQLGSSTGETLTTNRTNSFEYDSSVAGIKYGDANGNGSRDNGELGLGGWTIVLKRVVEGVETPYAQTITGADGSYSFEDVLPGEYVLYEQLKPGWLQTDSPVGSFTVAAGSAIADKDFGNIEIASGLTVDKSGPAWAHIGDVVPYVIVVTNAGNYTLTNIAVTDTLLSTIGTIPSLAPGASYTFNVSRTVLANDTDPLPNTATALATDVLGRPLSASDDHVVDILKPGITVVKTASPTMSVNPASVRYTYVVTNIGEETLTSVSLADDKLTAPAIPSTLAPGQSVEVAVDAILTADTVNVATVSGVDKGGKTVSDTDDAEVLVFNPAITITKTAEPIVILEGELVQYSYLVKNTGDIDLHDVEVTDDKLGLIATIPFLAVGAETTVSETVSIDADVTNVGKALGYYGTAETDFYGSVEAFSEARVDVVHPDILIEKLATPDEIVTGGTVNYSFKVTNIGDVALTDISVVDDKLGAIGVIPSLAAGASQTLYASTTLTSDTTNVATATGMDPYGHVVEDDDAEFVNVHHPSISIVKTASPLTILSGEEVTYSYAVRNTGDIELHDVKITDDKIAGDIAVTPSTLAPGQVGTAQVTAAVDVDTINVGTAHGFYTLPGSEVDGEVTDADDAAVDVIAPAIMVEKSATPSVAIAGTLVTYTFKVTNAGDVPLYDVSVDDDKLGHIGDIPFMEVGATVELEGSATLQSTTTNVVTAQGEDPLGNPVSDTDTETVPVYNPSVSIVKSADPTVVLAGENATYTYLVTNTGDLTLTDVVVTDDKLGMIGSLAMLAPGASQTFTVTTAIEADVTNVGDVIGYYGEPESEFFGSVTDSSEAFVDVVDPAIAVVKTATPDAIISGETVTYTYVVSNIGDVPLFGVALVDDKLGSVGTLEGLEVGASATFQMSTTLSLPTTNTVTATATDRAGHEVMDQDDAFVDVAPPFTDTAITKTADKKVAKPGEIVTYTLRYRVTTGATVEGITITDDFDERYMSAVDLDGGTLSGGKITWVDSQPLSVGEVRTISYKLKVASTMPAGKTSLRNVVVINPYGDTGEWTVDVSVGDPFLPFTGGEALIVVLFALAAVLVGVTLKRLGREAHS